MGKVKMARGVAACALPGLLLIASSRAALSQAVGAATTQPAPTNDARSSATADDAEEVPRYSGEADAGTTKKLDPKDLKGIVPIRDYSGDLFHRQALLGDLGGARTDLANAGVQFHLGWVQEVQSV